MYILLNSYRVRWLAYKRFNFAPFWSMNCALLYWVMRAQMCSDTNYGFPFSFNVVNHVYFVPTAQWSFDNKQLTGLVFCSAFFARCKFSLSTLMVSMPYTACHYPMIHVHHFISLSYNQLLIRNLVQIMLTQWYLKHAILHTHVRICFNML